MTERIYELDARNVKVDKKRIFQDLFQGKKESLIQSNHDDEIVHICAKDGSLLGYEYGQLKHDLREHYNMRTIFPVMENAQHTLRLRENISAVRVRSMWLVQVIGEDMFFFGDTPKREQDARKAKRVEMAMFPCVDESGLPVDIYVIIQDQEQVRKLNALVQNFNYVLTVRGMRMTETKGKVLLHDMIAVTVDVEYEKYDLLEKSIPHIYGVDDVQIWRDYVNACPVPTELESYILLAGLFYYREGSPAFNLIMLGEAGFGKSFFLDQVALLCGTMNHNCMESTIKGLIYSHRGIDDTGRPGILYTEKFVACLNEFVRIIGQERAHASKTEEANRLFTSLNDAVERKKNRSRSSGLVSNAAEVMRCSLITADNHYPHVIRPMIEAFISDVSYMRRYSMLVLGKETQERGVVAAEISAGKYIEDEVDVFLGTKWLANGRWFLLMRYWRSLVKEAHQNAPRAYVEFIRLFAKKCWSDEIDQRYMEMIGGLDTSSMNPEMLYVKDAQFGMLAVACLASAGIMNSTFMEKERKLPGVVFRLDDVVIAKRMVARILSDMLGLMWPSLAAVSAGVQRVRSSEW